MATLSGGVHVHVHEGCLALTLKGYPATANIQAPSILRQSNLKRVFSLWYHVRGKITECRSAEPERIYAES